MASKARNLGGLMGTDATLDINDISNAGDLSGVDTYADSDALALAVVRLGTQVYQSDTGSFKVYRGASGWAQIDDFPVAPSWVFQGTVSGYTSGGHPLNSNVIDKFPFAADGNATDVGDLTVARNNVAGQSSDASGYTSGGYASGNRNEIDKFPFASDANATDVGDLTEARAYPAGQSSDVSGYTSGGVDVSTWTRKNVIDKFPFASDANATDVGDLTRTSQGPAGQSSTAAGYTSAGQVAGTPQNIIDKFPFASDANATDVGDLTLGRYYVSGQQV